MKIAKQRSKINLRLDDHRAVLPHKREAEIFFSVAMNDLLRIEIVPARKIALRARFIPMKIEGIDPSHTLIRSDQQLKRAVRYS